MPSNPVRAHIEPDELGPSLTDFINDASLAHILYFLSFKDRIVCERVSKKFNQVSKDVNAMKQTSLSILGENVMENIIQNFCTHPHHRIWKSTDVIERGDAMEDIENILKKVPNLKALHFRADDLTPILKDGESVKISQLCPNLEHFSLIDDMIGTNVFNDFLPLVAGMKNLFHLEVRFPAREGSGKTEMLQENLLLTEAINLFKNGLQVLSTNVPLNSDNCRILSNDCNKIRKLSLVGTALPIPGLNSFLNEGGVRGKYLRCLSTNIDTEDQLDVICKSMICLQSFQVVINHKNVRNIGSIGQLRNLKNLFISNWSNDLLDEGLLKVFIGCRQLSSLIINGEVSDSSFQLLSNFCFFMKRIEINNGKRGERITDTSLYAFARLEYLHSLTLYYCEVSDAAVKELFQNCRDLQYLRLTCNNKLTKGVFPHCIEFAQSKPKERISMVFPERLERYWPQYLEYNVPNNLDMKFM